MEKQKLMEFDFKKVLPLEGSKIEQKISKIVTKKFLAMTFVIATGLGIGYNMIGLYYNQSVVEKQQSQSNDFLIAQQNKDNIINNLESQMIMYDDMVKDVMVANQKVSNTAQAILHQASEIRNYSQEYKEDMVKIINNFNQITQSEDIFRNSSNTKKELLAMTLKNYQSGSLTRSTKLENILMKYTTTDYDEKQFVEQAKPIREELKKQIVEKMSVMLGNNEITKAKRITIKR